MKIIGLTEFPLFGVQQNQPQSTAYEVLVEMNPGFRTLSKNVLTFKNGYSTSDLVYFHLEFPWMYVQMNLQYVYKQQLFVLYNFETYLSFDKAKKSTAYNVKPPRTARYSIVGDKVRFCNTHGSNEFDNPASSDRYIGIVPCYGYNVVYPIQKNLYDSVNWYLSEFLEIPFSGFPLSNNIKDNQVKIRNSICYGFDCEHSDPEALCRGIWK